MQSTIDFGVNYVKLAFKLRKSSGEKRKCS